MSLLGASDIKKAVELLKRGGLVAYPTDTLYGLGAHALSEEAVHRVYAAKGRPLYKAVPLLLGSIDDLHMAAEEVSAVARRLAICFWPGALTLVLKRAASVPEVVTGGADKVAVRVPAHPVPRELVRQLGGPITGTSANRSGGPDPIDAEVVRRQLGEYIDLLIDQGPCSGGQPSTVVDVTSERPVLIREGAISWEKIEEVCGV